MMKKFGILSVAALAALAVSAQIELVAPANGASVRQMHTVQREFAKAPWAKCEKCFDGAENAQKLNDTERNIYYYLDQAKKIGKQYKRDNE